MNDVNNKITQEEYDKIRFEIAELEMLAGIGEGIDENRLKELKEKLKNVAG